VNVPLSTNLFKSQEGGVLWRKNGERLPGSRQCDPGKKIPQSKKEKKMKAIKKYVLPLIVMLVMVFPTSAFAQSTAISVVGVGGYDLVSYHTGEKPQRGNGNHVAMHDGVTYLFTNEKNRKKFEANPEKFLPAYGGYCAYGVAVGKKFVSDPDVWEIVDGKLYLNLDNKVKGIWSKDIPGFIQTADEKWPKIKDHLPSEL
jgi:YHS domain-containing protein